ncbi:MAG: hypothetical protein QXL96_08945, partial [Ignisphaera sp.]
IGGLDRADIGKVIVDGIDICSLNERELVEFRLRKIGYVFQFYNLIPTLSVLENVELPMYLLGIKEKESKERAVELLQLVGILVDYQALDINNFKFYTNVGLNITNFLEIYFLKLEEDYERYLDQFISSASKDIDRLQLKFVALDNFIRLF